MATKFVEYEGKIYQLVFADRSTPTVPTAVVRQSAQGNVPVPGKLWATLLYEGLPVDMPANTKRARPEKVIALLIIIAAFVYALYAGLNGWSSDSLSSIIGDPCDGHNLGC